MERRSSGLEDTVILVCILAVLTIVVPWIAQNVGDDIGYGWRSVQSAQKSFVETVSPTQRLEKRIKELERQRERTKEFEERLKFRREIEELRMQLDARRKKADGP